MMPSLHAALSDVDVFFQRAVAQGLVPYDHQQPGVRPWGDSEFELDDPDGQRWAFRQV